ncbi:RNA-binding protein [Hahella aquimaris]|uniref:vWA domain-containing protein n=1 Tax=Hahella sp. HNIBRBA332 TaxID=3015983 RepID=UPI00273B6758|nr:RNA-binding protein [Hahella sp. HNIBRBA332]WLQ11704.1 RNA-binding protein [Hahella sp. HNIBRBA332]
MASKTLFNTRRGKMAPAADTVNQAGGLAYKYSAEHALAQYAVTGCFTSTFYASAEDQLEKVMEFAAQVEPEFIAKLAVFARERGFMKDMPALLTAILTVRAPEMVPVVFKRVIDNGRMVRNFVQIMRSGVVGRKSLGTMPKRLVKEWINARGESSLFMDSVGASPSMKDVIKMVRPKPENLMRQALYGYLIDREYDAEKLPQVVRDYEAFKADQSQPLPKVEFRLLTALNLTQAHWAGIARNAGWQMTRMNLNTFARQGVFKEKGMDRVIADRLRDENAIRKAKAFPYQLMAAYTMAGEGVPKMVTEALQDAMEIALQNVPALEGRVVVLPDTSGSMTQSVSGYRPGASSKVRCIDVAALVAAAILAKNKDAEILPFATSVHQVRLNPRDSVMTNATKLAQLGGGGTNCSAPLVELNRRKAEVDTLVFVSDNESWIDTNSRYAGYNSGTAVMQEWLKLKQRNPNAKMVCIDVVPNAYTQAMERDDILNVGGFSDQVFTVMKSFLSDNPQTWVRTIKEIEL